MFGGRSTGSSRLGRVARVGILAGLVWLLSSGCLVQVLHVSDAKPSDSTANYLCGTFSSRVDGTITIGVDRVTAPNVTIAVGLMTPPQGGRPASSTPFQDVWSNGSGHPSGALAVRAGTTYEVGVSAAGSPGAYDTDVGVVAIVRDAAGNIVPIDCVD